MASIHVTHVPSMLASLSASPSLGPLHLKLPWRPRGPHYVCLYLGKGFDVPCQRRVSVVIPGVGLGHAVSARESCGSHSQPTVRRTLTVTIVLFAVDQHLHVTIRRRVRKWYRKDCQNKMLGDMNKSD